MLKRLAIILFLLGVFGSSVRTHAQQLQNVCPYGATHPLSLSCLIPDVTQTGTDQKLARFNTTIAQVLGQLPLAAPVSGFVLGFDKKLGIPVEESQNLGSVLTERGNTVGKHKLFLGFTAQRFVFHAIDGTNLSDLPSVFQLPSVGQTKVYGSSTNFMTANMNQFTGIAAFGLTDRIDISITVPYERVSLSAGYSDYHSAFLTYDSGGNFVSGGVTPGGTNFVAGSASGFGDILVNMKGTVYSGEKSKVALGLEARFPTGDEYNLLGTGAYGVKPYIVFSRLGRITPHVNLGYQWNGFSNLYINSCYFSSTNPCTGGSGLPTLQLPHSVDYSAGADIGITKWLTFVGDFVGQHYYNAPSVTPKAPAGGNVPGIPSCSGTASAPECSVSNFSTYFSNANTVGVKNQSLNIDNLALGVKLNPKGRLIVSANALIRLDNGGLRPDRFAPLLGISYRF